MDGSSSSSAVVVARDGRGASTLVMSAGSRVISEPSCRGNHPTPDMLGCGVLLLGDPQGELAGEFSGELSGEQR